MTDGATETSFSGLWARLLAEAYCAGGTTPETLFAALPAAQATWREAVAAIPLPWYAEEKARQGAFAALVGLALIADSRGGRRAAGPPWPCGDSCLIQVRGDALLVAFPLASAAEFNNRPTLLSSEPASNVGLTATLGYVARRVAAGRPLLSAHRCRSRAGFSHRMRRASSPGRSSIPSLSLPTHPTFPAWVAELRALARSRNDDLTLLCVRV